jgi:hypothetical protein
MRTTKTLIAVVSCILLTNCATIIHGTRQDISFSSNPSGADVMINDQNKGLTPIVVNLERKNNYTVKIQLAGYLPYETNIVKKVDGWIVGNIIFGGIIGLVVDAATGGMYKLTPEQINGELKNGTVHLQKGDQIYISVVMSADPSWEKIGTLLPLSE